ncbi:hypothetical protein DAPPUDRAFT_264778 [Daphnia pulex]|uniref:Cuticular protein n=1 Tax=Daphnia pulex TaxID=6669 RepID=E9HSB1_DAPPU|nr:hypothetical protein DAPPUDRAFT_264778 [Daphnia pulex]|eukprot:EFX65379.1 hypothetical protein DAPPUDRAFT_264778 [Daphnia pulex]
MKVLILSIFLACASAQYYPGFYGYSVTSQFHAQDVLGQASYGYAYPGQVASNYRDIFGNQVGSYAYMGPKGEVRVNYVADAVNGFRVVSNNLPAPEDTSEVAAEKIEHAKLVKETATKEAAEPAASHSKRQVPFYPSALLYALPYTTAYYFSNVALAPLVANTTLKNVMSLPRLILPLRLRLISQNFTSRKRASMLLLLWPTSTPLMDKLIFPLPLSLPLLLLRAPQKAPGYRCPRT